MELRTVGNSGVRVSTLGLGTLTWGRDTDEHEASDLLKCFIDDGGNLIDTAPTYGEGSAESTLGAALKSHVKREEVILISKCGVRFGASSTRIEASRCALLSNLDTSLKHLGTDYLDFWMVSAPDPATPFEQTLDALEYALSSGRVRYVGLSNFPAWQLGQAHALLSRRCLSNPLAAVEMEYSLLQRGIEREVIPACQNLGVGLFAWSPLARGVLTGKYRHSTPPDSRAASAHLSGFVEPYLSDYNAGLVEALATAAEGLDRFPLEVALAWVRDCVGVSSIIVGPRTPSQWHTIVKSNDLVLPSTIRRVLTEISAIDLGYPERFR